MRLLLNIPNCDTAAMLNCKASDGTTPLHNACFLGQNEAVKFISESSNIDFTVTDKNGLSPLHYALIGRYCCNDFRLEYEDFQHFIPMSHNLKELIGMEDKKLFSLLIKYSDPRDYLSICVFLMKECHFNPSTNKDKDGNTPLHYAAWMTDTEAFNLLAGEDTFNSLCCNNHGVTTLHIASGNGNTAIVKFLVNDCKVQPTCKCKDGTTPLHWASETGHLDIIEILASQMPANYLDQRDSSGRSALLYAAARGHLSVLQYFIEELNCDPFCQDHGGNTILHYATLRGFTATVQYLLTALSWSGVLKNKSGSTPLHLAAWKGHIRIVQLLTNPAHKHTSTNTAPDLSGNTPLHIAASEGYIEIVSCLAGRKDFDVHCTTASGNTALHDACRKGHLDIVKFLVDNKHCNILLANNIGATPLHLSVAFGHADIVQFLCSKKSYNQFCNTVYWTPLHMVCSSGMEKSLALRIAQILLDQDSCDPSCTYNGVSPLHLASYSNNINLVKLLVCERGCDPLKPDNNGKLALHYAVEGQNADVVDFLISYEPESIMHEDHMGETPLRVATSENIVTKLLLNGADPNDIRVELSDKMSCLKNCVHLRGRSNVYIVGNHSSGKSTLVSALQSEHKGFFERFVKVTVSKDATAGIKSSIYEKSKCFGPVIIHDFAGETEYYCGHPALLSTCKSSGKPVFLIVANLTDQLVDIENQTSYWLQWVSNLSRAAECHSSVIIVGSHRDRLKPQELRKKDLYLQKLPVSDEVTLSHTTVLGGTTLNCQRFHSTGMSKLRKMLQEVCVPSQNITNIHSMLLAFTKFTFTTPIQLSSVQARITENEIPLPQLLEDLYKLYRDLDSSDHIVLLGNENAPEESWIVLDQKRILHVVNKFLHDAKEHPQYNSTGVVPFPELVAWFGDQFHPDFIARYLVRTEVCQQCFLHSERYYFFPVLLDSVPSQDLWSFNPMHEQYFGWCLRTKPHNFFPVKFLHTLFLELACTFVLPFPKKIEDCYIWKNGIRWFHLISGTEVVVHFCEQNTTAIIMARCKKGHEMKYYKHRSEILKAFIATSKAFHLSSVTKEYILHPHGVSKYQFSQPKPVSNLKRFHVSEIANNVIGQISIVREDKAEKSTQKRDLALHDTEIQDLHFEPFFGIQTETLQTLFSKTTEKSTQTFLQSLLDDMFAKWEKLKILTEIFGCRNPYTPPVMPKVVPCEIVEEVLDREETVGGLCHRLHQYSIFCGRDILEIANSLQLPVTVTEPSQDLWFLTSDIQVPATWQNPSMLATGSSSTTPRDHAATLTEQKDKENWEYWTLHRASADVIRALADNCGLCNTLANHLKANSIIGSAVYEYATNAIGTTESHRVGHLITALLSKVKEDPKRYYDFIQILQLNGICQDAEAALRHLPTVNPADDIASSDTETVKDDAEVVSQSDHRSASPIWKLASSTPLDIDELTHIKSELIHDVTEWCPLGQALGLDSPTLEKIEHDNQGQVDKCMADLLNAWLRQKGHVASWQTLAEALSQPTVNKVALANRIAATYTSVSPETLAGLVH